MKSIVCYIGPMAMEFQEEKVLIFFGSNAPEELKEVAIIHDMEDSRDVQLTVGNRLIIDDQEYQIIRVGSEAYKNLLELGHISVYFTEPPLEILPGSVYVTPHVLPRIAVGTKIEIKKGEE